MNVLEKELEYKLLGGEQGFGDAGSYGIKIMVSVDHEFTEEEKDAYYRAKDILIDAIKAGMMASSPKAAVDAANQRSNLLSLFPATIFFEELPNGYCPRGCCKHLPWFAVMTPIGRVEIGWRKRVISIDWSKSMLRITAEELFTDEASTMGDRFIHAWGYDKAREYVKVILSAVNK